MYNIEELEERVAMPVKQSAKKRLAKLKGAFRRDWNGVNPVTKVDKVRTKYDRKQNRRVILSQED